MDEPRPLTTNWGSSSLKAALYPVEQMNHAAGPA
jgi:hypothetical protein